MVLEMKAVPGHDGYFVDPQGNIYSNKRKALRKLKLSPRGKDKKHQHLRVMFSGDRKSYSVHRVVYEAFKGPIPEGLFVCHKNDNPADNRIENLYLGTCKQNTEDAFKNRKRDIGDKCSFSKLKTSDVLEILALEGEMRLTDIANIYGVSKSAVLDIFKGRTWKHVKQEGIS